MVTVVVMPDLITYMCTHSSPHNSNHNESEEASRATGAANSDLMTNVIWTQEDETALIDFLIAHKSEAELQTICLDCHFHTYATSHHKGWSKAC